MLFLITFDACSLLLTFNKINILNDASFIEIKKSFVD